MLTHANVRIYFFFFHVRDRKGVGCEGRGGPEGRKPRPSNKIASWEWCAYGPEATRPRKPLGPHVLRTTYCVLRSVARAAFAYNNNASRVCSVYAHSTYSYGLTHFNEYSFETATFYATLLSVFFFFFFTIARERANSWQDMM
jgi:hypothetical protein